MDGWFHYKLGLPVCCFTVRTKVLQGIVLDIPIILHFCIKFIYFLTVRNKCFTDFPKGLVKFK